MQPAPVPSYYRTTHVGDRSLTVDLGSTNHEIFLTNEQKQTISFRVDSDVPDFEEVISSEVILESRIGRIVLDGEVTLSKEAFAQIADLDYSFFRFTPKSPTTMVLPPSVDRIGLHLSSRDKGRTWIVGTLTLFD